MMELPKAYNSGEYEDEIYKLWEEGGFFQPKADPPLADNPHYKRGESFTISMPPPNVTGTLHMGHAMMLAIQDIMTRYHRLKGDKTLWLPGLDHASIATQNVVEKKILKEENKTRHDLGREEFIKRAVQFAEESKIIIRNQVKKMGASCDWSRERYTLDEGLSEAVRTQFVNMYHDGLIYRGYRIVNWCVRCQSTLADDEVEYKEEQTKLYTFRYDKNFPEDLAIATTRPETKFGDTAVALHPDDPRAKKYTNKEFTVDIGAGPMVIKVIVDEGVDKEFGTGVVGVTPAHSMIDAEFAKKHNLPSKMVIDELGKMVSTLGEYGGLKVKEAREKLVEQLRAQGLLISEKDITHNLAVCYRCGKPIEPLVSKQWFIGVDKPVKKFGGKTLKEKSVEVVQNGSIKIIPDRFEKIYYNWMNNLHDWCISRQLWFGHRIPVWYKGEEIYVGIEPPTSEGWKQDSDTLDTWFSSGLWTFSTLGWPKKTKDLATFHPTSVMETGYDILPLWVARMILMTEYALEQIPFKTVYLHGLVRDRQGRKMSKSLGNGIDPLEMIKKYGADATRLSLFIGTTPGNDVRLYEEKIAGFRNFANKVWNIGRYVLMSVSEDSKDGSPAATEDGKVGEVSTIKEKDLSFVDVWFISRLREVISEVTRLLEDFQFSAALEKAYDFAWHEFADWYVEATKILKLPHQKIILARGLESLLKLLHVGMPFVTEALWKYVGPVVGSKEMLIVEKWPEINEWPDVENRKLEIFKMGYLQQLVTVIRTLRAEAKVESKSLSRVNIMTEDKQELTCLKDEQFMVLVKALARVEKLDLGEAKDGAVVGKGVVILEAAGR